MFPAKTEKRSGDQSKPVDKHFIFAVRQMPMMPRLAQVDLIAELKRRQVSPLMREGKDGTIEDIITGQHLHQICAHFQSVFMTFPFSCYFLLRLFCSLSSLYLLALKAVPFTARSGKRLSRLLSDSNFNDLSPS